MGGLRVKTQESAGRPPSAGTLLRTARATGLAAIGTALMAVSASAHPFGEPSTVRISADGTDVTMRWTPPADDLLILGGAVGALPGQRTYVFDLSPDAEPEPVGPSDAELITNSPKVAAYLAENLAVRQDGQECESKVALDEPVAEGALVVFGCAQPVSEVEIEITMLTDLHEAYRTAAIGEGETVPDRTLYTIDEPVHHWSFGSSGQGSAATGLMLWVVSGALAAVLGVFAWIWRRARATAQRGIRCG